ncbi:ABC transporter permease [Paracoccus saliphilus]|uniref:Peptide/nickel transport system permease protein n=2 Tax=Paracoccus saliphilus TaxID=405559 RepID=A0AA45W8D3_9RHOB|nr:ABC transporter permease [Paracoccus saliphilus]SIT16062.1 peptide/nickel transport system permease protein [Paracoccus saliphilus]
MNMSSDQPAAIPAKIDHPVKRVFKEFVEDKVAVLGLALFILVAIIAIAAPLLAPQNPYALAQLDIMDGGLPPGEQSFGTGMTYWLGTDTQGRDMLSAIMYGLRISLLVAFVSLGIAISIGVIVGVAAAYFGGRFDAFVMRIVDLQLSFPAILIALILLALFGRGVDKVILALVIVQWAYYARTVRSSAIVERRKDYIDAARCLALSHRRIMFRHLLPNCVPPLIVVATVQIAQAIALEATLSFLGVGVPITEPSLGLLIANGYDFLLSGRYWISLFPGIALVLTIIGLNLVGDRLRDVLNPRLQK